MVAAPSIGSLLLQQVERSKAKQAVVVQFAATLPGDASQVSVDWWLTQINQTLRLASVPVSLEFADLDHPARVVSAGEADPIRVTQLKRKMAEMQLYIDDLEATINDKAGRLAAQMIGRETEQMTLEERALRAVNQDGYFIGDNGARWVDIATEAKRVGKPYITIWRAATGATKNKVTAWVVGSTNANGDRILVKQGSFAATAKKGRKK